MKAFNRFFNDNLVFIILTLLLFTQCYKEINTFSRPSNRELAHAKHLFSEWKNNSNEFSPSTLLMPRTDSLIYDSYNKIPDWSNAVIYFDNNKKQTVIEVPILQNIQSAYYYEDQDNTSDTTFSSNQRSLVIIQDSSGFYFLAVCNIIPNENYVLTGGINSNNNYRTKENSFDGVVFYTDWDDYILEGYKFTDGECSAIIDSIVHDSNDTVNILRPRTDPCFIIQICERIYVQCGPITFGELQPREFCEHIFCQNFIVCPETLNSSANGKGGYRGTSGLKNGWNNSGNGNSNGSGNSGGLNLGHFKNDCGDNPGFTNELSGIISECNTIFKGNYPLFKKCLTTALFNYGEEVNPECVLEAFELDNEDCIMNTPGLYAKIVELLKSNISSACDPTKSVSEIINELTDEACAQAGDPLENIEEKLEKGDYIIETPAFKSVPRLKCLWEKLKIAGSSLYCNTFDDFEGVSKHHIQLDVQHIDGTVRAHTYEGDNGIIHINIDWEKIKNDCDIKIMTTLMHEGLHAFIENLYLAANKYNKNIDDYFPNYQSYLNKYKNDGDADHEYLAAHWLYKIVDGLKDIYGNAFTDDEYLAFAWQGLQNTDAWLNLTNTQKNQINTNLTSGLSKCTKTCL
ncbi:MAG: hypothetical protein IPO78_09940 [Saprospiraceae bacterium]|nr:hypothetical protein [Saprospiraceae bacterium]